MERTLCTVLEPTQPPRSGLVGGTRESTISVVVVRALVEVVEQSGVPRSLLLSGTHLTAAALDATDTRLPRAEGYRLCERALKLTNDPAFGLHWAERLTESTFVPLSNLIVHSTSLREGLESLRRFFRLLSDDEGFQVVEQEDEVIVRCRPLIGESLPLRRFISEMVTVGFLNHFRRISMQVQPTRVSFDYPAPAYRAEYERVFRTAERFDQPFTGIVFDRALLNVRSPYNDADMQEALREMAQRRLMRITRRTPYALRVREVLVRHALPNRIDMDSVARTLGMSVRSLRRLLAAEGKPYGDVLNEALAIVAKQLLRDDDRTIQEISDAMGFADKSTFYRSFKRWTGLTPNAYRQLEVDKA
jgi:AraC-like DNA-binding protein